MARRFLSTAFVLLGAPACTDPTSPQLAFLAVTPPTAVLVVGDTVRLTAAGLSFAGDTIRGLVVTWASSDTLVATVSLAGLVTGRGQGTATITAASGGIQGPAGIAVTIHFATVAPGVDHDCALTAVGMAYCWGENYAGQLGDGGTAARSLPAAVVGGHRFVALAAGASFTCGIATDSLAWCWGGNYSGTLGIGSRDAVPHATPVPVFGGRRFREISATWDHICGLTSQGDGYCWGRNWFGVLGTASPPDSFDLAPAPVTGGLAFGTLATAQAHSCGVTLAGATHCWGANFSGELGAVTDTLYPVPVLVVDTLNLLGLDAGGEQACALDAGGAAVCWGSMEIGEGYWSRRSPERVAPGLSFVRVATAYSAACGLDAGGAAWCWGSNWSGELGDGTIYQPRYPPVLVSGGHAFADIDVGSGFACGLEGGGAAYCWGSNTFGKLGKGTFGGQDSVPVPVVGGHSFRSIVAGVFHACGIAADSTAWCWGSNREGELGDSSTTNRSQPTLVRGGLKFVQLTVAGYTAYTCGVTSTGAAYCWGNGSAGQLGTGSTASSTVPVPVFGGHSFTHLAAGGVGGWAGGFTCGVTTGGAAYCWGGNRFGTLGRGDTVRSLSPVAVAAGALTFAEVAAGTVFACGRTVSASVYCWGGNPYAQMGQGSLGLESLRPIPVQGAHTFARVAVGQSHSCGLAAAGSAWCWGRNWEGQLGAGDSVSSIAPRGVAGGLRFASLTLGYTQSCGLTAAGAAYCWGEGRSATPSIVQPGVVFLSLTSSPGNKACGVRADSTVACFVAPYGATLQPAQTLRPTDRLPRLPSEPLRPRHRARRSP